MKFSCCIALTLIAAAGLSVRLPAQTGQVKAFTGARVIDGTTAAPIDNATLLVRDGRLVSVGPAASVTIPDGAARTPLAGKTVIPGLINAHGHVGDTAGLTAGRYSADQVMKD